jgi:hypothetical protein
MEPSEANAPVPTFMEKVHGLLFMKSFSSLHAVATAVAVIGWVLIGIGIVLATAGVVSFCYAYAVASSSAGAGTDYLLSRSIGIQGVAFGLTVFGRGLLLVLAGGIAKVLVAIERHLRGNV